MNVSTNRLREALLVRQLISEDQWRIALMENKGRNEHVGKVLIKLGFITEARLRDTVGEMLDQQSIDLSAVLPDEEAIALISEAFARRHKVLPVTYERSANRLVLAMADTLNVVALDQIRSLLGVAMEIVPVLAGEAEILRAIDEYYGASLSVDGLLREIETGESDDRGDANGGEQAHPLVRLVDALITDAVQQRASDIHFEPEQGFLRIRYRIDGVLRHVRSLHRTYWSAISVRLKVMATLNIAETRTPQDGRMTLSFHGRSIDFRVATLPTLHGENIVLRILDRQAGVIPLERLGFTDEARSTLELMMSRPEGIILVTGPTGSGKTTTLYAVLSALNTEQVNVMTLEDPVEYPMPGIRQAAVNESARLDFAGGTRAMMRQDPDVIFVGEIRDGATAEMAVRAAMTGHQVYSTLHATSALGAIPRLLDLGLRPDLLAGHVIGIVAQRLVRRLCPHCRTTYGPGEFERRLLGDDAGAVLWGAVGCDHCDHRGYRGRIALTEVVRVDDDLDDLIARRATLRELRSAASAKGYRTLADDGMRRVLDGTTTLDEVSRVVDLTTRLC